MHERSLAPAQISSMEPGEMELALGAPGQVRAATGAAASSARILQPLSRQVTVCDSTSGLADECREIYCVLSPRAVGAGTLRAPLESWTGLSECPWG